MPAMQSLPDDHPLMVAFKAHQVTEEYANSKRWAAESDHVDGTLWALFMAGWHAHEHERFELLPSGNPLWHEYRTWRCLHTQPDDAIPPLATCGPDGTYKIDWHLVAVAAADDGHPTQGLANVMLQAHADGRASASKETC